jgi:hypothetical protein
MNGADQVFDGTAGSAGENRGEQVTKMSKYGAFEHFL